MKSNFKFNILILFITMLFSVNGGAAENADSDKPVELAIQQPTQFDFSTSSFTEVVSVEGATAEELYYRSSRSLKNTHTSLWFFL